MALTAAFRVDASRQIGSGHVYRCLALAEALRSHGVDSVFIHRAHVGNLHSLIESRGFSVRLLPPPPLSGSPQRDADYPTWLGVAESVDVEESADAVREVGAKLLFVDHYGVSRDWEYAIRRQVDRVVVIEDLPDREHDCDVLIDQSGAWAAARAEQDAGLNPDLILAGPNYALVDPIYREARQLAVPRSQISRILVFFGASDHLGLTEHALRVLNKPPFDRVAVDVVIGTSRASDGAIERLADVRGRATLHEAQRSLAPLMLRADLMIGAAGMTSWERCAVGLPSIAAVVAENQLPGAAVLEAMGAARCIDVRGHDGETRADVQELFREELLDVFAAASRLRQMSEGALRLSDGLGAARAAEFLVPRSVEATRLRVAREDDAALLFRWANDGDVRKASFSSNPIGWDEHRRWFAAVREDPEGRIWILETESAVPLGQFRVTQQEGVGVLDYSVDADFRGRGFGRRLLALGLQAWRRDFPAVPLRAATRPGNERSRAALSAAGWTESGEGHWDSGGRLTILTDRDSWISDFVPSLIRTLLRAGHQVHWAHSDSLLAEGDICFILGYSRILDEETLGLHSNNLVVHESDLPRGRGWSPLTWQVLDGVDEVAVSLIEAGLEVDSGHIYAKESIRLRGDEFIDELRAAQWSVTQKLCERFVEGYPDCLTGAEPQKGEPSYYTRRRPNDSRLELNRRLADQMQLLRVVDNRRYPAFVEWRGRRIRLEVRPESNESSQ